MAGVALKILTAAAVQRLRGMEERGENLSGVLRSFGAYMEGSIQKNFDAGGRPVKWAPLAAGTKLIWLKRRKTWRTQKGNLSKIGRAAASGRIPLTDTARLRRSIRATVLANGVMLGTNLIYAAIHQFGGQAGRGKKVSIPARPYLLFQDEDVQYFGRLLNGYLMTGRL